MKNFKLIFKTAKLNLKRNEMYLRQFSKEIHSFPLIPLDQQVMTPNEQQVELDLVVFISDSKME